MKRRIKLALGLTVSALAVLLVAAVLVLRTAAAGTRLCAMARGAIADATGAEVEIGRCVVDPVLLELTIEKLKITPPGRPPLVAAEKVFARLSHAALIRGRLRVEEAQVLGPQVNIDVPQSSSDEPPAPPKPPAKRCLPAELEDLAVDALQIRDGQVGVRFPGGSVKVRNVRLDLEGDGRTFKVALRTGAATYRGPVKVRARKLRLEASLDVRRQSVVVDKLDVVTRQASVFARGSLSELCKGRGQVAAVINADLAEAARAFAPEIANVTGRAAVTADAKFGHEGVFEAQGDLTVVGGGLWNLALGDLRTQFTVDTRRVELEKIELPVSRGLVTGSATLGFSPPLPLRASLALGDVEIHKLLDKVGVKNLPMRGRMSGSARVWGALAQLGLEGELGLATADFAVVSGNGPAPPRLGGFRDGRVDAQWRLSSERFTLARARVQAGRTTLSASGTVAFRPPVTLDLTAVGDPVDLAELSPIAGQPAAGQGAVRVNVRGPQSALTIATTADLRDLRLAGVSFGVVSATTRLDLREKKLRVLGLNGQKGRSTYALSGELDLAQQRARARLDLEENRISDLIELAAGVSPAVGDLRAKVAGTLWGSIDVDGPLLAPQASAALRFADLDLFGQRFDAGELGARLDGRAVRVEELWLVRGPARVQVSGDMGSDLALDVRAEVKGLNLDLVDPAAAAGVALDGKASLSAHLTGTPQKPVVAADFEIDDLAISDAPVGPIKLKLGLEGRTLKVSGTIDKTRVNARADLDGAMPFFLNAGLRFDDAMAKLPPAKRPKDLALGLSGSLEVAGSLAAPLGSRGKLSLDRLDVAAAGRHFKNRGAVLVDFRGKSVSLKQLTMVGGGAELSLQGVYTAAGMLDLQANGSANLAAFDGVVPSVDGLGGHADVSASVTGSLAEPQLIGSVVLRGVALKLRAGPPIALKNLGGRIAFSQSSVVLEGLSSDLNSGQISARGEVALENYKPGRLHLSIDLSNVDLKPQEDLPIVLGGRLELYGRPDSLVLGGDVEILRLRFARAIAINFADFVTRGPPAPKVFDKEGEFLRFDLGVHAARNIKVETQIQVPAVAVNALARLELRCDLKVTGTNRRLGLLGSASSLSGTALFKGNEFEIESTVVSFGDAYRIAPSFDVNAVSKVRDYKVHLHAYGTPAEPKVDLSSEPELPEADIITLLTLGLTSQDIERVGAQGAGLGLLAESAFSGLGLDEGAKNLSPLEELGFKDVNVRVSSMYSESSGRVEPTIEVESKFLFDELKLRGSTPFSGGKGKRARAEYRLSDRLSLQMQLDDENSGVEQAPVNLGFGFKLHWVQQ